MNRKERKLTEKKLGLTAYYKTMSRSQKFEKTRQNIIAGNQMQEEMKKKVRVMINEQMDEKESNVISATAEIMAKLQKIPIIDAMTIAKEELDATKK